MNDRADRQEAQKVDAAERAVTLVRSGTIVGLGTGSTADHAIKAIGREVRSGAMEGILGIATSRRTELLAEELGIPLTTLEEHREIDITIDGADEVDPSGNLIKGGGGALLREKIVAQVTRQYVIIVDETKIVDRLAVAFPVPVEVVKFGWRTSESYIESLGAEPVMRFESNNVPYETAAGNYILDCRFEGGIEDPAEMQRELKGRAGIVETGLFVGFDPKVIVGRSDGS